MSELFDQVLEFPDIDSRNRLNLLVGMESKKISLAKLLGLLINKNGLLHWFEKNYPNMDTEVSLSYLLQRPPLVVLSGDVGSGKTELAETIGDMVARDQETPVYLYPLSLSTRGQGRVGEMTQLINTAFDQVIAEGKKYSVGDRNTGGIILLIDEADALAQSRELDQMHHEDRAGVNAFIRGIDRIAKSKIPVAVIMCTNRLGSLDPAIRRRSADILTFERPNALQRRFLLTELLTPFGLSNSNIDEIVTVLGDTNEREHGVTYSDIVQRFFPNLILEAYPDQKITFDQVLQSAKNFSPTKPFCEE